MDDLPELPFEQILSYLSLEDRLKARAVSKGWREKFDRYPAKSLCFSERPSGFIIGKSRLVSDAFAHNFIHSNRFEWFFNTFGCQTVLSSLKNLRLCDLNAHIESVASFAEMLQSFVHLEQLDLIRVILVVSRASPDSELNLPMLHSLRLDGVNGFTLTLNAPALKRVRLLSDSFLKLELVHGESVEWLLINKMLDFEVKKLKKLKYLYFLDYMVDLTLLTDLQELEELHLQHPYRHVKKFIEQKQRYGRTDLKIFQFGLLLDDSDDERLMNRFNFGDEIFFQFVENPSRMADEIPCHNSLYYVRIERVAPEWQLSLLNRFVDLKRFFAFEPVQDVDRFLLLLKNFRHITELDFYTDQPQDLFDRLPEHCAVQRLTIKGELSDLGFLFKLKHLIDLNLRHTCPIDAESIRKAFGELPFLSRFHFKYQHENVTKRVSIEIKSRNRFQVSFKLDFGQELSYVPDLNSAIELITN